MLTSDSDELSEFHSWLKFQRGFEPPQKWDLFTLDIEELTVISVGGGQLVIDRSSTTGGRQTMHRS